MLEIFLLIRLGRSIASRAHDRGRRGTQAVLILLGLWFGCEFLGAVLGLVLANFWFGPQESNVLFIYAASLVGAIVGARWAFRIVDSWPMAIDPDATGDQVAGEVGGLPKFPG